MDKINLNVPRWILGSVGEYLICKTTVEDFAKWGCMFEVLHPRDEDRGDLFATFIEAEENAESRAKDRADIDFYIRCKQEGLERAH